LRHAWKRTTARVAVEMSTSDATPNLERRLISNDSIIDKTGRRVVSGVG
jgi:hypothetical protein